MNIKINAEVIISFDSLTREINEISEMNFIRQESRKKNVQNPSQFSYLIYQLLGLYSPKNGQFFPVYYSFRVRVVCKCAHEVSLHGQWARNDET